MACSLTNFKLPQPDVRLVTLGDTVVKIKLRFRGDSANEESDIDRAKFWSDAKIQYDIERVIIYVLTNDQNIEPIRTDDLVIYPYKKEWPNARKLEFSRYNEKLKVSPYLFLFFIERLRRKEKVIPDDEQRIPGTLERSPDEKNSYQNKENMMRLHSGKHKFSMSPVSDESFDFDSSSDEETQHKDQPGMIQNFFHLLMTPMKSISKIWK